MVVPGDCVSYLALSEGLKALIHSDSGSVLFFIFSILHSHFCICYSTFSLHCLVAFCYIFTLQICMMLGPPNVAAQYDAYLYACAPLDFTYYPWRSSAKCNQQPRDGGYI